MSLGYVSTPAITVSVVLADRPAVAAAALGPALSVDPGIVVLAITVGGIPHNNVSHRPSNRSRCGRHGNHACDGGRCPVVLVHKQTMIPATDEYGKY